MILDTCFIIDSMDNEEKALLKLQGLTKKGEPQIITSLSIFELFTGLGRSTKPQQEKEKIMKRLNNQLIILSKKTNQESWDTPYFFCIYSEA